MKEDTNKPNDLERVLVLPKVEERSEHVIEYVVAENVTDLVNRAAGKAISFPNKRMLELAIEFNDLFGFQLVYLSGFPGAVYDAVHDKLTWALERVSYDQLVADLAATKRIAGIKDSQAKKVPHKGEAGPKTFAAFSMHGANGEEIDDDNPPE